MNSEARTPGPAALGAIRRLWQRHRRTFWILHSVWALAFGVAVLILAHRQYAMVPWVAGFLAVTWASTFFFSRVSEEPEERTVAWKLGRGFASWLTRTLYQETLFFLLPFYAYSAVLFSWNTLYVVFLGALAVLACLDLVFDRWLNESPAFGMLFFASVAFAALNLLIPLLAGVGPRVATPVSAMAAVLTAVPLVTRPDREGRAPWLGPGLACVFVLVTTMGFPELVPPVPLRLQNASFAADVSRSDLSLVRPLAGEADVEELNGRLAVRAQVFAPSSVPAAVSLRWTRDGEEIRTSREVKITAHAAGFRVWDIYAPDDGRVPPGRYTVTLRTSEGRIFGRISLRLRPGGA